MEITAKTISDWVLTPSDSLLLALAERGMEASSIGVYGAMWRKFLRYCEDAGIAWHLCNSSLLARFIEALPETPIRQRYLKLWDLAFTRLTSEKVRMDNPVKILRKHYYRPEEKQAPTALWQEMENRFIAALPAPSTWKHHRDRVMLLLFLSSGLKPNELLSLTINDTHLEEIPPFVWIEGKNERAAPVAEFALKELQRWVVERKNLEIPGTLLFPSKLTGEALDPATLYRQVKATLTRAKLPLDRAGGQMLRNSFALRQLQAGTPATTVKTWMGLRRVDSLDRFKKLIVSKDGSKPV